jgi:hypothetical protein
MNYRQLKNGQKVAEAPKSVPMTIDSKCPRKWLFVDMETGDVWMHRSRLNQKKLPKNNYTFFRADEKAIQSLMAVAVLAVAHKLKELE